MSWVDAEHDLGALKAEMQTAVAEFIASQQGTGPKTEPSCERMWNRIGAAAAQYSVPEKLTPADLFGKDRKRAGKAFDGNAPFEKLVECAFLLEALERGKFDRHFPLSGKPEQKSADAVFGKDAQLVLVEYKRSYDTVVAEVYKYREHISVPAWVYYFDSHHALIYAVPCTDTNPHLALHAESYFRADPYGVAIDCLDQGIPADDFDLYLKTLRSLKKGDDDGGSPSIAAETSATFRCVYGIGKDGISGIVSYEDYVERKLRCKIANTPTRKKNVP